MMNDIVQDAKSHMEKAIDVCKKHLATIRTGRAHVSLLDGVRLDYYGTMSPISQVATVSVLDAKTLVVKPWEKPMIKVIEKAILEANLGLTPSSDSDFVRIPMPQLTEERRKEFAKQAKTKCEEAKVAVRNARRDANELLKEATKASDISEDEEKRGLKAVQDLTDHYVVELDKIYTHKEAEIMTV